MESTTRTTSIRIRLSPVCHSNMQRRAFIIFIKTIFLGFFVRPTTLFPLHTLVRRAQFRRGTTPIIPVFICPILWRTCARNDARFLCFERYDSHQNILRSWAASDLKNDPSHVTRTKSFLCLCLPATPRYVTTTTNLLYTTSPSRSTQNRYTKQIYIKRIYKKRHHYSNSNLHALF